MTVKVHLKSNETVILAKKLLAKANPLSKPQIQGNYAYPFAEYAW
jgi:hypothetical protein